MEKEKSPVPLPVPCWACGAMIAGEDRYCRYCGRGQGGYVTWQYKHWGVIAITLLAGPLSLVFLWRSPVISRNAKLAYTAAVSLLTLYFIGQLNRLWLLYQAALTGMTY